MNLNRYREIVDELKIYNAHLVAVSKTKPVSDISILYGLGQRMFGENKVQEMCDKYETLPKDIDWHLIGHLQTNKVKYVAPFVSLIHAVDSLHLLLEIDKHAKRNNRMIACLLQVYIASEETKFGMDQDEIQVLLDSKTFLSLSNIEIHGLMGMATNTENKDQINKEFESLKILFDKVKEDHFNDKPYFRELSMGMSSDYHIALEHGATLIRVGSDIFGSRGVI